MKKNSKTIISRVSKAAVGRILSDIIALAKATKMSTGTFHRLMMAASEYIESGSTVIENLPEKWTAIKDSIDKAAVRAAKARERAARRRKKPVAPAKSWSPSDVRVPAACLDDLRKTVKRNAGKKGKNVDGLDCIKSSWDMSDRLSQPYQSPFPLKGPHGLASLKFLADKYLSGVARQYER